MRHPKRTRDETSRARALAQLAESGEPALQRELEGIAAAEYFGSRGFRKAWDRLLVAFFVGR